MTHLMGWFPKKKIFQQGSIKVIRIGSKKIYNVAKDFYVT